MTAPSLLLVDMGAPLQESLRRLQGQLARVEALAAQEEETREAQRRTAPTAASLQTLLQEYRSSAAAVLRGDTREAGDGVDVAALRRRVAQKLQRLQQERHMDLCTAYTSLSEEDLTHILPTTATAAAAAKEAGGHDHRANTTQGVSSHGGTAGGSSALSQLPAHHTAGGEEDDVFGWVTADMTAATGPPHAVSVPPTAAPPTAAARAASVDVHAVLGRIACAYADAVECKYRHACRIEDVQQQLLRLQRQTELFLTPASLCGGGSANTAQPDAASPTVGTQLQALLSYKPTHVIASVEEQQVWQRAWQRVQQTSTAAGASSVAAPSAEAARALKVGDEVEFIDVAVLAQDNVRRYTALQRRWCAMRQTYEKQVEGMNHRLAQAALQLEEMERRR